MEMKKLVKGLAAAGFIAFAGNTFALTEDGDLDATSTGTVDIDVTVGDLVRISGLVPMTGSAYDPAVGNVDYTTPACIYRNGSADYEITATSTNGVGTNFYVSDGTDDVIYTVSFDDGAGNTATLDNAVTESSFTGANQTADDCSAGAGGAATVSVSIIEDNGGVDDLQTAPAGTYTDELELIVAPR